MPQKHRCTKCGCVECKCEKKKCSKCGHRRCKCENKNNVKQNVVQKLVLTINVVTGGTGSDFAPIHFEIDTGSLPDGDGDIDFRTGSKKEEQRLIRSYILCREERPIRKEVHK